MKQLLNLSCSTSFPSSGVPPENWIGKSEGNRLARRHASRLGHHVRAKYDAIVIIGEDDGDILIGRKVSVSDLEGIRGALSHTEFISSDFPGNLLSALVAVVNLPETFAVWVRSQRPHGRLYVGESSDLTVIIHDRSVSDMYNDILEFNAPECVVIEVADDVL
jgi:hypothetical protein